MKYKNLLLYAIQLLGVNIMAIALGRFVYPQFINAYIYYIVAYMVLISIVSYTFQTKASEKEDAYDKKNTILISQTIRLLSGATVLLIYFVAIKTEALSFVLNFFILYFICSVFEIRSLISNLRPHFKKDL
jgi:hypothetical protein